MTIAEIIAGFREQGAFFKEPTATANILDDQEQLLKIKFPASYREAVEAGSYDKATFHFLAPYRDERDPRFVIFASWNNILFGFDTAETSGDEFRIFPISDVVEQDRSYADFGAWFKMVFEMATRPSNPE